MTWAKRIVLFLITNILVMLTIAILVQLLGLNRGLGRVRDRLRPADGVLPRLGHGRAR